MQKQKLDGKSMDLVANNIDKLKQIFPDVFSEGQINFEKLQAVLGEHICEDEEHYKFTWHGKKKAKHEATKTTSTGTLRPDKDDSKNWDSTDNVFIEGDNLEVLKLLQKSYHNKIKMIYIDPPYNTGKDFVYKDNYKDTLGNYKKITGQLDSEGMAISSNTDKSGRYHTDWLNMMYPRLKLARNLLKDDGVIFISIDDNEQANLKKMCDEIFGEDNCLGNLTWHARGRSKTAVSIDHEYILLYAKNKLQISPIFKPVNGICVNWYGEEISRDYNNPDNDKRGVWRDAQHTVTKKKAHYTQSINRYTGEVIEEVINNKNWYGHYTWMYPKKSLEQLFLENRLFFLEKEDGNLALKVKKFKTEELPFSALRGLIERKDISSRHGSEYLDKLLYTDVFEYPKPPQLIYRLLNSATRNNDIILDFFAGSGTTGDAVMQLNAEDGGNRKYICVQLDEPISGDDKKRNDNQEAYKFCTENNFKPVISSITKERLRRAGDKIITDAKKELKELLEKKQPDDEKIKLAQEKLARILGNKEWIPLSSSGMTNTCHSVAPTIEPTNNNNLSFGGLTTEPIEEILNQVHYGRL